MSLTFTDEQIKNLTKDILLLPTVIDNPTEGTGLIQQRQAIIDVKSNLEITDAQNKVYSDHFISVLQAYHDENLQIRGESRTTYSDATLISAGAGQGAHYPQTWLQMIPMLLPENNGAPVNGSAGPNEESRVNDFNSQIDLLKNGFTDGTLDTTLVTITNTEFDVTAIGDLAIGQRFIVDDGTQSLFGTVDGITGMTVEYTKIAGVDGSNFGVGDRVQNSHPGFTNAERGHQSAPYAPEFRDYLQGLLDADVDEWETNLNAQKTALMANTDIGTSGAENANAIIQIDLALSAILSWESTPIVNVTGKYTDSILLLIEDAGSDRTVTDIPARLSEITNSLGSVAQAGDGSFSGSGRYFDLFNWINNRVGKSGGSLFSQNSLELGVTYFDQRIVKAQNQLDQYEDTFAVATLSADSELGQIDFDVNDASEFSVAEEVKVMDNDSVIFTRIIDTILGNNIRLDSGIPSPLTTNLLARIVKQK